MFRVTPIYGSRWDESGAAKAGNCTLVEYANVRVLVNVGLYNPNEKSQGGSKSGVSASAAPAATAAAAAATAASSSSSSSTPPDAADSSSFWSNLPPHDCLVLTDSTLESMGSLPLYVKGQAARRDPRGTAHDSSASASLPSTSLSTSLPPIFATFPTAKMGQMTLYDCHANVSLDGGSPPFTLEDIDQASAQLRAIKYAQTMLLPIATTVSSNDAASQPGIGAINPAAARLAVTLHLAGHVVGGSYIVLERLQDNTRVVLTTTYSLSGHELHLEGSTLMQHGSMPDVLVTRPGGPACPLVGQLAPLRKVKSDLFASPTTQQKAIEKYVLSILRRDGNVLIPVDASGRILELLLLMNKFWDKESMKGSYNLIWMGSMVHNTLDYIRSQLEWMKSMLGEQFEQSQGASGRGGVLGHPFALPNVELCTNLQEMEKIMANGNGSVVLASGLTMDHGPSRDLLLRWADNDNNAILFTDSSQCFMRQSTADLSKTKYYHSKMRHSTAMGEAPGTGAAAESDLLSAAAALTRRGSSHLRGPDTDGIVGPPTASTNPLVVGAASALVAAAAELDSAVDGDDETEALAAVGSALPDDEVSEYTTAYQLLRHWCQAQMEDREMEDSVQVDVFVPKRTPLAGPELKAFLEQEEASRRAQRQREEEQAMLREVELAKGRLRLGEDGGGADATYSGGSGTKTSDAASAIAHLPYARSKKKSRFDSSLFLKFSKPLHLTFEIREDAVGVGQIDKTAKFGIGESTENTDVFEDDYGISVRPEHFVDIVTGVDPSKFAGGSGRIGDEVKKRGLGFASMGDDGRKRQKGGDDDDDDLDEMDERGLETADLSEGTGIVRGRNGRPPIKVSVVPRKLQVFAEIEYIPLEGRQSSADVRRGVRTLQPRELVVLGGPKSDTDAMDVDGGEKDGSTLLVDEVTILAGTMPKHMAAPSDDETVELDVGFAAYKARLITMPYRSKAEKEKEDSPPEPVELYENQIGKCMVSLLDYVATGQKLKLDGSIVLAPKKKSSNNRAVYVSDGEVRLTHLIEELGGEGMKAVYSAHAGYTQLLVNGIIVVKKMTDSGKIDVEGPLCQHFFKVRSIVLSKYAVLE